MALDGRGGRGEPRRAFTLIELLVVAGVVVLLVALLLPATRQSRGAARRMMCQNNCRQLGLALGSYHETYSCFPAAMIGDCTSNSPLEGHAGRLSGWVLLLPYFEQGPLWEQISNPLESRGVHYPAMGPAPWISEYPPWQQKIPSLLCPTVSQFPAPFGPTTYAFCVGDVTQQLHDPRHPRGAFACRRSTRRDDISDGQSNTIACAEITVSSGRLVMGNFAVDRSAHLLTDPSRCLGLQTKSRKYAKNVALDASGRGSRWADGAAGFGLVTTVLAPNRPSCAVGGAHAVDGIYSAGSLHEGGVQILMVDGSVRFCSEEINAGDPRAVPVSPEQFGSNEQPPSPYGTWGALGTAAADDQLALE